MIRTVRMMATNSAAPGHAFHYVSPSMKMDLLGLQMLVSAIESKSLSRAAENENLATSGASKRIAELERRLGAVLLVRQARGAEPTPVGRANTRIREYRALLGIFTCLPCI
ncbi:LysR family transcriptional regulator [Paraburkholderia sp. BR10937]|uniref:LysR family transcriptional regulator n=1 Tax=Paraburkholderia sp. BR10937 TaxID=3236994 RepID=UPI0034D36D82